jgi:hypothetical protein
MRLDSRKVACTAPTWTPTRSCAPHPLGLPQEDVHRVFLCPQEDVRRVFLGLQEHIVVGPWILPRAGGPTTNEGAS